jgi:cyclic pyranopterin phosphate synthase
MTRRADIKTGTDCNSNCVFCVIGDQLFTGDRSFDDIIAELRASRASCDDVVFTGAEVTIRPDFLRLVAAARLLKYRNIQIQTNGRRFAYLDFCKAAVAAGANEFSPSIHGHIAKLHDGLTRSPGSFNQIVTAIRNLRALGQRIVTNTVATRQNMRHLPALAQLLVDLGVDQFQIAFPHPTGHAATYFNGVVPRMPELAPFVREAMAIGERAGARCMVEAMPYCQLAGIERFAAELYIPPTEIVFEGFVVPDYERERVERGKTRFAGCAPCRFEPICEGPWREYPEQVGADEFVAVPGPRVLDGAVVMDDRFDMLGTVAPPLAISAPCVAVVFYPEEGSAACNAQAANLAANRAALEAAGITPVRICPDGETARAWRLVRDGRLRRTTFLLDGESRITHILVEPDVHNHAAEILAAQRRLHAPPRPIERGPELVVIRRRPVAEIAAELSLSPTNPDEFT